MSDLHNYGEQWWNGGRLAAVGGDMGKGLLKRHLREMSSMKRSIHIEAPVEKVFDFVKDPRNVPEGVTMPYEVKDVRLTDEGVGTYYGWAVRTRAGPASGCCPH
jgi:hypothetical protein